jgi:hypothetical protein
LILDEPTVGVDPLLRRRYIWNLVKFLISVLQIVWSYFVFIILVLFFWKVYLMLIECSIVAYGIILSSKVSTMGER